MEKIKKETHSFQSEAKELLHLMIHSLYSNKEIFIREIISNASDAIDKLRFYFLSHPELNKNNTDFHIYISIDKKNNTLSISDNGIGMSKNEIIENLGTIAKSGTKKFINELKKNTEEKNKLIGQFGVGFYSTFIVSRKVIVKTKSIKCSENEGVLWESFGKGEYSIQKIKKKETGTEVILFLNDSEKIFLEEWKINNIIKKYSDHISIPVKINSYNEKEKTFSIKQINKAKALWNLKKTEIKDEEYQNFYKYISNDINNALIWTHNTVEGTQEYTILLYIPSKAPWDMWNRDNKHGLKLYVKKVYIMDDVQQFLPNYLRFVRGIIDSYDMPLNVSREILQENKIVSSLKKTLTKRILKLLEKLSIDKPEKYQKFWNEFGLVLKEGIAEDLYNKETIANLLRFTSVFNKKSEQTLSLESYIKNMQEKQEKIFFITSDSYLSAKNSPHLEFFKKNNIDVLLLSDKIDEWMMNHLTEFKEKKFQSISKNDESLNNLIQEENINQKIFEKNKFIEKVKDILKEKIKEAKFTNKLTETPVVLVTDSSDMSTQMAKLFSAAGQKTSPIKYIFEINPNHLLIKHINNISDKKQLKEWVYLLFEQALFVETGSLEDPNKFVFRLNKLLTQKIFTI
ncbi:molecular chaperone HtpG [Buchnera aphidicola]|uniref:molecular chaperone HtpG n=1 Tax=Buchnera aphidicola TaxID=9 RepID=UPI003D18D291